MEHKPITNTQIVINSKELLTRINWLKQQLNYRCSDAYSEELKTLNEFARNIEAAASVSTYDRGADLIRDSGFEEYAKEEAGRTDQTSPREEFNPVDFDGVTYWLPK
jgi:hypothetical protein